MKKPFKQQKDITILRNGKVQKLKAPYTPERYTEALQACIDAGMQVVIIDSASHEWDGKGGVLQINEALANAKYRGNT